MGKIYAEVLEEKASQQFDEALQQDFVVDAALMPDAHTGYTLPIGAVVACKDHVVPSYVGYDIGCGMCAAPTTVKKSDIIKDDNRQRIFDTIYRYVPVGIKKHREKVGWTNLMTDELSEEAEVIFHKRSGWLQLGTLGGGNHFIELGYDEEDRIWIVVHSGSRGAGHGIASHYMAKAAKSDKPLEGHHALHIESDDGLKYINDLNWCLQYALDNRSSMIRLVEVAINSLGIEGVIEWGKLINRNHNHAELNNNGLWIHRKGATHAEKGMMGVIPGNMRDGSFIVQGKGNPEALCSSSHGAGRVLGRWKAKKKLKVEDFESTMKGITAKVCHDTLDESPFAYKDIFEVMRLQSDLVEVKAHIKPLINIKG